MVPYFLISGRRHYVNADISSISHQNLLSANLDLIDDRLPSVALGYLKFLEWTYNNTYFWSARFMDTVHYSFLHVYTFCFVLSDRLTDKVHVGHFLLLFFFCSFPKNTLDKSIHISPLCNEYFLLNHVYLLIKE